VKCKDPPHECGGPVRDWKRTSRGLAFGLGGWRLRALHLMAGGLPSDGGIRRLGGCHLMLTQVYTSRACAKQILEIAGLFT